MKKLFSIALLQLLAFCAKAQTTNSFPIQTAVQNGAIEGVYEVKTGLQMYFGVPYAKPPVGELRWKAPQPLNNWNGVLATKAFSSGPVQAAVFGDMIMRGNGFGEDLRSFGQAGHGLQDLAQRYGAGRLFQPRFNRNKVRIQRKSCWLSGCSVR